VVMSVSDACHGSGVALTLGAYPFSGS